MVIVLQAVNTLAVLAVALYASERVAGVLPIALHVLRKKRGGGGGGGGGKFVSVLTAVLQQLTEISLMILG